MRKPKKSPTKLAPMKKTKTTRREDIGRLLLDVGKLVLGSIILGGILRRDFQQDILLISGVAAAVALFALGIVMVTREIKAEEKDKTGRLSSGKRRRRKR